MEKILVIEDEHHLRESLVEMLELTDFEVISAIDGEEGIQKAHSNTPDLIICDVMMPKKNGYEVLQHIRTNYKLQSIPFIFLTAKVERKDIRKGMNLSADDYITKPFEYKELIEAINTRLERIKGIRSDLSSMVQEVEQNIGNLGEPAKKLIDKKSIDEIEKLKQILNKQNDVIDKYCYINSHKLRAPLCRILGLVELIEQNNSNDNLIEKLKESADDLDQITRDINDLLSNTNSH